MKGLITICAHKSFYRLVVVIFMHWLQRQLLLEEFYPSLAKLQAASFPL